MTQIRSSTEIPWYNVPAHFFKFTDTQTSIGNEREYGCLILFRRFLVLKISAPFIFASGSFWPLQASSILVFFAALAASLPRNYIPGLLIVLGLSFYELAHSFPFTINHAGLELAILVLLCLDSGRSSETKHPSCTDMIKLMMLSVWFYSGVHKLVDGYYLNGEFFSLEALSNETTLGRNLHQIFELFLPLNGLQSSPLACCTHHNLVLGDEHVVLFVLISWLTIFAELLLPWTVLLRKGRTYGILALFVFQTFVSYFSGEIDFAFTAFAVLFLFVPKIARITYPILACLFLWVHPWA